MSIRMIDYYVKNLPFDARQEIFDALEEINVSIVKKMLEKESGYPGFRRIGSFSIPLRTAKKAGEILSAPAF